MITEAMLVFIISSFCQFKDPKVSRDYKEQCMEAITNCAVKRDGLISNKSVNECRERWIDQETRNKRGF